MIPTPSGVAEAAALTQQLDTLIGEGFARLTSAQADTLNHLASALQGSPLGEAIAKASTALAGGELLAHHLAVVAAGRAALEGARADALLHAGAEACGLVLEGIDAPDVQVAAPSPEATVRMESARQWLTELALGGLHQLEASAVVPVMATLEGLQALPELQALASMLTGFAHELLDHAPTSALAEPPTRRWADLWSRAMRLTYALPEVVPPRPVSGSLTVLGADVRHHEHLVSAVVHGLLHDGEVRRLVQVTLSAWKVDAIGGAEIWTLLRPLAPALVDALVKPTVLQISDLPLRGADLGWSDSVTVGPKVDPFATDLEGAVLVAPPPRDRHPIQVAIPVVGVPEGVPVSEARLGAHSGWGEGDVAKADALIGLLRFDETWSVHPLHGRTGKKALGPATAVAAAAKQKTSALGVLRERASKLLRA